MGRRVIRQLRPGEFVPHGEPKRYRNSAGYVRLRWKVGLDEYVEVYEHRVRDYRVVTDEHVHHLNGVRDDNRLENLAPVGRDEHLRGYHGSQDRAEAARLYASGLSTIEVGRRMGIHPSSVYNHAVASGVRIRKMSEYAANQVDREQVRRWHSEGVRVAEMARRAGVCRTRIEQAMDAMGLPRFTPGRPYPLRRPPGVWSGP